MFTSMLAIYYGALALLILLGIHRLYLVYLFRTKPPVKVDVIQAETWKPSVTVQLPIFNEATVVERLIDATAQMDWPRDRFEIQVLDDSTDLTQELARACVEKWKSKGISIHYVHRENRTGYKAGALANGMKSSTGEFLAIFDADFIPTKDFLQRTIPEFQDEHIGLVQARWGHLNEKDSWLTRVQALMIDSHFTVEHLARTRAGFFINFNGTAGVWRRTAIDSVGGWQADTLTEDLDLSYRAQLAGWKFHYLPDVRVPAELPTDILAFKSQQRRWCKGSVQTTRKLLPKVLNSSLKRRAKVESFFHLTANWAYVCIFLLVISSPFAMVTRWERWGEFAWLGEAMIFSFPLIAMMIFFDHTRRGSGESWKSKLIQIPLLISVGVGVALNNAMAVLEGLSRKQTPFVRTPKQGSQKKAKVFYAMDVGWTSWLEAAFALYLLTAIGILIHEKMWGALPFLLLFALGYLYVTFLTLRSKGLFRMPQRIRGGR